MKRINNDKGIALVMVLVLSLISLALVAALLFMATEGTKMSGAYKFFRTADEAGIGGVDIAADFISKVPQTSPALTPALTGLAASLTSNNACLFQKLNATRGWGTFVTGWSNCSGNEISFDAATNPDFTYETNPSGAGGIPDFRVYAKIVDTVKGNTTGNVTTTLRSMGVVSGESSTYPQTIPDLYRIEVQAQNATNPKEVSRYSVLYAR